MNTQHGAVPPNNKPVKHLPWDQVQLIAFAGARKLGVSRCDADIVASDVLTCLLHKAEVCREIGEDVFRKEGRPLLFVKLPDGSWACAHAGAVKTIARYKVLEYWRSEKHRNARLAAENRSQPSSASAEEEMVVRDAVEKALGALTVKESEIVRLRAGGKRTWQEVATEVGGTPNHVRDCFRAAQEKVCERLGVNPNPIQRLKESNATSAETAPGKTGPGGGTLTPVIETEDRAAGRGSFHGLHPPNRRPARPFNDTQSTSIESRPGQGGQQ